MDVEIRGLDFAYPPGRKERAGERVLEDFDLEIASRSVHAIVGPTGCGKSTLLRLVAGLEKPSGGTIAFRGTPTAPNRVAVVFQDPALLPWWNVERNVGIGVEFDHERSAMYSKVKAFSIDRVGLRGLARRMPHTLSRGQKSRAGVARAMAYDADVMLLDEPFVHLDAIGKQRLWEEFETHWHLEARTYVLVTHDIEEAVLLADRVTVLSPSPATIVDTIEVGISRPRDVRGVANPAFRSAISRVWDALESGMT